MRFLLLLLITIGAMASVSLLLVLGFLLGKKKLFKGCQNNPCCRGSKDCHFKKNGDSSDSEY